MAKRLYYGIMERRYNVEDGEQDIQMVTRTYNIEDALYYISEVDHLLDHSELFIEEFVEEYTECEFCFDDLYDEDR